MNRHYVLASVGSAALILAASLSSYGSGAFPGGKIPNKACETTPSCGKCHRPFVGGAGIKVSLKASALILSKGQKISVTSSATGGANHPQKWGGFASKNTAGKFTAGSTSQADASGQHLTHRLAFQSNGRKWVYGYTAPGKAGLVRLFTVVNTVNGNGRADGSDFWAFPGAFDSNTRSTPVWLYVLADKVKMLGAGCPGSYGNQPVLGSKVTPKVGASNFSLEVHGAAASAPFATFLGANAKWTPLDLSAIGVTGCKLLVDSLITLTGRTGGGTTMYGDGSASVSIPIPNNPSMRGATLQAQSAIIDTGNGRQTPITMTNGLSFTIQ